MKQLLIDLLIKCLYWLGWHPFDMPFSMQIPEFNKTDLEHIELSVKHEVKYPRDIPQYRQYVAAVKRAIPGDMSQRLRTIIEENMIIETSYDGDTHSVYPVINAKIDFYYKKKVK